MTEDPSKGSASNMIAAWRFLGFCARHPSTLNELERRELCALASLVDPDLLIGGARRHHMLPLVFAHLKKLEFPGRTQVNEKNWTLGFQANMAKSTVMSTELSEIIKTAHEKNITVMPFKGPVLSKELYGDSVYRVCDDLDLLVSREDLPVLRDLLLSQEYFLMSRLGPKELAAREWRGLGYTLRHRELGFNVDLDAVFSPAHFRFGFDARTLFKHSRTVLFDGHELPSAEPEYLLAALCVHGAKHGWVRLNWLGDVAGMWRAFPEMDPKKLQNLASEFGIGTIVQTAHSLASAFTGTAFPEEIEKWVEQNPKAGSIAHTVVLSVVNGKSFSIKRFHKKSMDRFIDKVKYFLLPILLPSEGDWKTFRLPKPLFPLYYLLRPIRLAGIIKTRNETKTS